MSGFGLLRQVFAQKNFLIYVCGNSISLIGNWVQRTAIAWIIWDLTHSVGWLGVIAFADLFPAILIGPIGGLLADRLPRRNIIMTIQSLMLLLSFSMACLAWMELLDPYVLAMIVTVHGVLVGLNQPARLAFVSALIEPPLLPTAVAVNSIVFNSARFLGPALAGIFLTALGSGWTFFANSLTYLPLLLALGSLQLSRPARTSGTRDNFRRSLAQGAVYLWHQPGLRLLLASFLACSVLVRPVTELLPAVADGTFARGAEGLAWMSSALGVGAILGGYSLATHPDWASIGHYRYWLLGSAASVLFFVAAQPFEVAVIAIAVCGFCFVIAGVGANTIVQTNVPDELRGRVLSLYGMIIRAAPATGALLLGLLADHIGLMTTMIIATALFALVLGWIESRNQVRH